MASTIKVDNVQNQPGTNIINKCSVTTTIGAGAGDTINVCGATVNIGRCGGTVALACGATQTGFGRTGTVDWVTTPKVTGDSPVTAATGSGYFLNTTSGQITINLPAGAAGSIVSMADYAATWHTNKVTVAANGSEKIGGVAEDATLDTIGQSVTFVYVDGTQGWVNTMDSTSNVRGLPPYIIATGGTPCAGATCGDYKIHTFTAPGTLCVSAAGTPAGSTAIEYLVVAGGGGTGGPQAAGCTAGGGAGAGGGRFVAPSISPLTYPAKPLCGSPTPANLITAAVGGYPITVGGGGAGGNPGGSGSKTVGVNGSSSIFSIITSAGGGQGQLHPTTTGPENAGGSGGGNGGPGGESIPGAGAKGAGNTPPTTPSQGNPGGLQVSHPGNPSPGNSNTGAGGGGGMMAAGSDAGCNPTNASSGGGDGGAGGGFPTAFGSNGESCGSYRYYAGGGGGGSYTPNPAPSPGGSGGLGGGGDGKIGTASPNNGDSGTANTGGGGGAPGGACSPPGYHIGGSGGSGIVVIRYKFQ